MQRINGKKFLTVAEAARMAEVSENTINLRIKAKTLVSRTRKGEVLVSETCVKKLKLRNDAVIKSITG